MPPKKPEGEQPSEKQPPTEHEISYNPDEYLESGRETDSKHQKPGVTFKRDLARERQKQLDKPESKN
jgi:hypothetical protein